VEFGSGLAAILCPGWTSTNMILHAFLGALMVSLSFVLIESVIGLPDKP
jgi:energy-converting hydrogenase Eha subunit B